MAPLPSQTSTTSTTSSTSSSPVTLHSKSSNQHHDPFWDRREFICGWGAALINICTTFPINKVMFRQMVHGVRATRALDQLRSEGLSNLYKGLLPPLMSKTASVSLMFGTYSSYRSFLDRHQSEINLLSPPMTRLVISAFLAGSTEAILTPFERMQMLLQSREYGSQFQNTFKTMKTLRPFGIYEYYRGLSAILLRNGPSNILFFATKEKFREFQSQSSRSNAVLLFQHFLTGAALGATISTIFYPINVVRTKMQTVVPGSPHLSILRASKMVYRERNGSLIKVYYGCGVNCTRALLSWGIINVSYEVLRSFLYDPSELEEIRSKGVFFVPPSTSTTTPTISNLTGSPSTIVSNAPPSSTSSPPPSNTSSSSPLLSSWKMSSRLEQDSK